MTYKECTDYILSIPKFAEKLGVDNLNKILDMMDHPEKCYPVIHVAGTNGKGSVCSFLGSILCEKGKRVGIFTSPHLVKINERIRINSDIISDDDFTDCFAEVMDYVNKAEREGISHPSFFEFVFLLSAIYFRKQNVDYVIFETGMGGRLDATNVVNPILCIITSVGLDHMQYLGDTIEKIAAEKAGIIKPGVPVVFFDRHDCATDVITDYCKNVGAFLHIVEKNQYKLLKITKKTIDFSFKSDYYIYDSLKIKKTALYQIENAVLSVRAYELLSKMINTYSSIYDHNKGSYNDSENDYLIDIYQKNDINDIKETNCTYIHKDLEVIRKGLIDMNWPGRMQRISDHIYVDGAHNEEAIMAFCHTLEVMFPNEHKVLLFAVSKDKDYKSMIKLLCRITFDEIIIVRYIGDRAADIDTVANIFRESNRHFSGSKITTFEDIKTGFEYAKTHVDEQYIFCVGSLYLVGDLLKV